MTIDTLNGATELGVDVRRKRPQWLLGQWSSAIAVDTLRTSSDILSPLCFLGLLAFSDEKNLPEVCQTDRNQKVCGSGKRRNQPRCLGI